MAISADDVRAGQAIYTRWSLTAYDFYVLGFSCRYVWKCPARTLLDLYDANVSANHLELGVGTGYFLDRCRFPVPQPRIALVDLNRSCLAAAARRIARYQPEQFVQNALEPFALEGRKIDSAGINFVLHCLPGTMHDKGAVFDHLRAVVNPGGVIFGSTVLWHGVEHGVLAKRLTPIYNRRRIFTNFDDTLDALHEVLDERFRAVDIHTRGSVALFRAVV
jgi:ubiquinone/menaquinone biosynthesis C-methylase UbiE